MEGIRVSNKHYAAIGRVVAKWAFFESNIDLWIWTLMNLPAHVSVCLTGQMVGSWQRLDAFIALVRAFGANAKWNAKLERLAKDAKGWAEQRNRAVHDVWDLTEPNWPSRSFLNFPHRPINGLQACLAQIICALAKIKLSQSHRPSLIHLGRDFFVAWSHRRPVTACVYIMRHGTSTGYFPFPSPN
jgi:hypothetical protein